MPQKDTIIQKDTSGRQVFLKEFVRRMIMNSYHKSSLTYEALGRIRQKIAEETNLPLVEIKPQTTKTNQTKIVQNKPQRLPIQRTPQMLPRRMPSLQLRPRMPLSPQKVFTQQKPVENSMQSLSKIQMFLRDPSVSSVECVGANKNLLIHKSGIIQSSNVSLSSEEINSIIKDFSEKTKIPVIPGIFKALYNNLLITAVNSESSESKFIVEKHFGTPQLPRQEKK